MQTVFFLLNSRMVRGSFVRKTRMIFDQTTKTVIRTDATLTVHFRDGEPASYDELTIDGKNYRVETVNPRGEQWSDYGLVEIKRGKL